MPLNHRQPIFDAKIWFEFDGGEEFEVLRVEAHARNRLKLLESTGFFSGYTLYFGDEIEVDPMGVTEYRLRSVVQPSTYVHYFSVWGIPAGTPGAKEKPTLGKFLDQVGFTDVLLELKGEWECEMGGLLTVHCPRSNIPMLEERTGWSFSGASEEVSGPFIRKRSRTTKHQP
jgi:hypothetical protein